MKLSCFILFMLHDNPCSRSWGYSAQRWGNWLPNPAHPSFWIKNQVLQGVVRVTRCLGNEVCFLSPLFASSTQTALIKETRWLKCELFNKGIQGHRFSLYAHDVLPISRDGQTGEAHVVIDAHWSGVVWWSRESSVLWLVWNLQGIQTLQSPWCPMMMLWDAQSLVLQHCF